jgi:hypothetical protein
VIASECHTTIRHLLISRANGNVLPSRTVVIAIVQKESSTFHYTTPLPLNALSLKERIMIEFAFYVKHMFIHHFDNFDRPSWHYKVVAGFNTAQEAYDYCEMLNDRYYPLEDNGNDESYGQGYCMARKNHNGHIESIYFFELKVDSHYTGPDYDYRQPF